MSFSIGVAQFNAVVGDLQGNAQKIIAMAEQAHAADASVLLTPELALCGYAPQDLLLRPAFIAAAEDALRDIFEASRRWPALTLVVGHAQVLAQGGLVNAASVIRNGELLLRQAKQVLVQQGVLDEARYFSAGTTPCVFEQQGLRVGVLIGAEARLSGPVQQVMDAGAQVLLVLDASPFHLEQAGEWQQCLAALACKSAAAVVSAHAVGGQDDMVFAGQSLALDAQGGVAMRAPLCREQLARVRLSDAGAPEAGEVAPQPGWQEALWHVLVLAVRDYVNKTGFPGVCLGLSGGMDSALVLALAVDALGADRVRTVMMPSPYTADISLEDAREMVRRLGVRYDEIAIEGPFAAFNAALAPLFAGLPEDTTEENLQARVRGTLLMALSNKTGAVVLTTSNKSESATGYGTLYGDMAGGFALIKDVTKTRVYALARWRNAHDPYGTGAGPIPERIITRAPSAELRPDQTDQDSLPPYDVLDALIERYVEQDASIAALLDEGFAAADVERVTRLIQVNEYKRRQGPLGPGVTRRSLGRDWRYPVVNRFRA
ncbi:NAD+ synthase [Comamonas faecalis]|uniref:Glutamine-dependent NAD(+) synthetase n=1 Tax=Comamonas faecalis TaxID=1387849 RepID=A0ABP7RCI3_9BURK